MVILATASHDAVPEAQHISIMVFFPDEIPHLHFKIKKTTKLTKIYHHIARKYSTIRHGGAFRLEFLGETLRVDDSTPEDMNMEDGDCLYLFWITRPGTAVEPEAESITLRVKMPDETEPIHLRMKTTANLFKLNNIIADQLGVSQDGYVFRLEFLGETLILDDSTPQDMHMQDWDCLYLFWNKKSRTDVEFYGESVTINVKVPDEVQPIWFKIKATAKLIKLHYILAEKLGVSGDGGDFKLEFLGKTILLDLTPQDINLRDEDCIHLVWIERSGTAVVSQEE